MLKNAPSGNVNAGLLTFTRVVASNGERFLLFHLFYFFLFFVPCLFRDLFRGRKEEEILRRESGWGVRGSLDTWDTLNLVLLKQRWMERFGVFLEWKLGLSSVFRYILINIEVEGGLSFRGC